MDMEKQTGSKPEKEYVKAIYCHCTYLIYIECIMGNGMLDEAQAGTKTSWGNINFRYADDESEEELNSLLMKVKEESKKAGLKLNIQ